jgi:hypothetical protein
VSHHQLDGAEVQVHVQPASEARHALIYGIRAQGSFLIIVLEQITWCQGLCMSAVHREIVSDARAVKDDRN